MNLSLPDLLLPEIRKIDDLARALEKEGKQVLKGHIGNVKTKADPSFIRKVMLDVAKGKYEDKVGSLNPYPPFPGFPEVRKAIADYLGQGKPENYLQVLGSMGGSFTTELTLSHTHPRVEKIFLADVGFQPYHEDQAKLVGLKIEHYDVKFAENGEVKVEWPELEDNSAIMVNPIHNPSSAIFSKECLKELFELAKEKNHCWVWLDRVYDEVYLTEELPPKPEKIAEDVGFENLIEIYTFSKCFKRGGKRYGFIKGPKQFIDLAILVQSKIFVTVPTDIQHQLYGILEPENVEYLRKTYFVDLRRELRERMKILKKLRKFGIRYYEPKTIYTMINTGWNSIESYEDLVKEKKVTLVPGTAFGKNGINLARLCPGALYNSELEQVVNKIGEFYQAHAKMN